MKIMRLVLAAVLWLGLLAILPAAEWFVATNGTGNGTNWANATNSLQGAINASSAADTVWVSNGVYEVGGVTNFPTNSVLTNRVAIYKAITVRSVNNNPTNTIIKGAGPNSSNAVRCVYMTNGSALIGFTLTNGATFYTGLYPGEIAGGGVYCQSTNTVISNCVLTGNSASYGGGGAWFGTLFNCILTRNSSWYGGGAMNGTMYNCTLTSNSAVSAGGAYGGILYNCILTGNSASYGGGAYAGTLYNCILTGNSATYGGGTYFENLFNCTVSGNSAGAGGGGGTHAGTLINCIVYFNSAPIGSNWYVVVAFTNTCTAPAATNGVGNITSNPMFVDTNAANYRLREGSPAINAGANFSWMTDPADARSKDLDGQHRIDGYSGQVDMGCYEYLFRGTIFTVH